MLAATTLFATLLAPAGPIAREVATQGMATVQRPSTTATFANPIRNGADPTIVWAKGMYHYSCTTGRDVRVWSAPTLGGLKDAEPKTVFRAVPGTRYAEHYWAPEFLNWRGRIYLYFAADDGKDENHRMYVLRAKGDDPRGPYDFLGEVRTPENQWSIDGFAFPYRGQLYFFWSGWQSMQNRDQRIYVARMRDPATIAGSRVEISRPEFAWERRGWPVNEGPAPIAKGRAVSLTYSGAGGSTPHYALGRLFNPSGDLMNARAWTKDREPVFAAGSGMFAPGHNSFFTARDGKPYI
ncbi:hypothetical protein EON77_08185, partial [bacterium]